MHTPGPWIFAETKPPHARGVSGPNSMSLYGHQFAGSAPAIEQEGRANAALIATAPELLAFLERLAPAGDWYHSALEFNTLLHDGEELERDLLALIAKAKGGAACTG